MTAFGDIRLRRVLSRLEHHWLDPTVGLVAAGVFSPSRHSAIATSVYDQNGRWSHAEREAIASYERMFGKLQPDSSIVVTLSPCVRSKSVNRVGGPCLEFLAEREIRHAHIGVIDPIDSSTFHDRARELGISVTYSRDPVLCLLCKRLAEIFGRYQNRVNWDLLSIKKEIGDSVFRAELPNSLDLAS